MASNETGTALIIGAELVPGLVFQTFGIGHIANGHIVKGLAIMVSYWLLLGLNACLAPFGIGIITGLLTWIAFMVLSPANIAVNRGH